jgi:Mg/Co/Ni transporter MgtE
VADIRRLIDRHRVLEVLAARQEGPKRGLLEDLQHRQNTAELQRHVRSLHAADVAYALEALPPDDRRSVWDQVSEEQAARVFVEVDAVVRESLVDVTPRDAMVRLLNGTVWGAIVGLFAFVFYASAGLGVVMSSAVVLNLVVAAVTGVAVPLLLHAAGRDLAQGSSVLLTLVTDAMGFFLFLGLASVFLV